MGKWRSNIEFINSRHLIIVSCLFVFQCQLPTGSVRGLRSIPGGSGSSLQRSRLSHHAAATAAAVAARPAASLVRRLGPIVRIRIPTSAEKRRCRLCLHIPAGAALRLLAEHEQDGLVEQLLRVRLRLLLLLLVKYDATPAPADATIAPTTATTAPGESVHQALASGAVCRRQHGRRHRWWRHRRWQ